MKIRYLYLLLCIIGLIVPYYFFSLFLADNGMDTELLVNQLFASNISTFFAVDVIISAIVVLLYVFVNARKEDVKHFWIPMLGTLVVGPSFGLPLYLFMGEKGKIYPKNQA